MQSHLLFECAQVLRAKKMSCHIFLCIFLWRRAIQTLPVGEWGMQVLLGTVGCGVCRSIRSADAYKSVLFCADAAPNVLTAVSSASVEHVSYSAAGTGAFVSRSYTGVGSAQELGHGAEGLVTTGGAAAGASSSTVVPTYPNGANNGLVLVRKTLVERNVALRGFLRGVHVPAQLCHSSFNRLDKLDGQGDLLGRKLLAVKCGGTAGAGSLGVLFFDITGPWS